MTTLVNKLKEQYETQYQHSITPVELRQLNSVETDFVLNKPSYAVLDTENNRAIHLHGANYQLIPYEKILVGLSDALDKYNIDINDTSLKFKVSPDLNGSWLSIILDLYTLKSISAPKIFGIFFNFFIVLTRWIIISISVCLN